MKRGRRQCAEAGGRLHLFASGLAPSNVLLPPLPRSFLPGGAGAGSFIVFSWDGWDGGWSTESATGRRGMRAGGDTSAPLPRSDTMYLRGPGNRDRGETGGQGGTVNGPGPFLFCTRVALIGPTSKDGRSRLRFFIMPTCATAQPALAPSRGIMKND